MSAIRRPHYGPVRELRPVRECSGRISAATRLDKPLVRRGLYLPIQPI